MNKKIPCEHECRDFLEKEDPSCCSKTQNICVEEIGQDCYIRELEQQLRTATEQLSITMGVIKSLKGDREWQYVANNALAKTEEVNR